ncbi:protein FAM136A-like [Biomphalaria glabrata]|uniref:Protein FAM136A-like n=2 Tax=Biomphalaria TaxID=6525 RepID=A0A9W3AM11_BIOGL|nr:protein FAM136A-like [Biomphalaria glabrata]KAI8787719.1 protein FAM136A [Biomphalaria glabrata]KAK0057330.1 protein FAM136A [Biomphalaria pfeifferi]
MDGAQARVEEAISKMVNSLDTECLRKMQVDMYQCSAKCCQDSKASLEDVQRCIDNCSKDVNKAQAYLQNEIEIFQNRLQRCAMSCQDKIRDELPAKPSDRDVEKTRHTLEKCVIQCADKHVELVPALTKKMLETLKNRNF